MWEPERRRNDEEERLHRAIWQHIQILAPKNVIAFHPANGGARSKRTAGKLKAMGVVPGVPDLVFVLPDARVCFLELKSSKGRLSPDQRAFADKCAAMGVEHHVTANLDEALSVLRAWGVLPKEAEF